MNVKPEITIGFWNVRGLSSHEDEILKLKTERKIDILFILETWLPETDRRIIPDKFRKYKLLDIREKKKDGVMNGHSPGGIMMIAEADIEKQCTIIDVDPDGTWGILRYGDVIIAICYFAPTRIKDTHIRKFWNILQTHTKNGTEQCILMGDFNARMKNLTGDTDNNPRGKLIEKEWISDNNDKWSLLLPNGNGPTFYNGNEGTSIPDHVFATFAVENRIFSHEVIRNHYTPGFDHYPIKLSIGNLAVPAKRPFKRWDIAKFKLAKVVLAYCNNLKKDEDVTRRRLQSLLEDARALDPNDKANRRICYEICQKAYGLLISWIEEGCSNSCEEFTQKQYKNWSPRADVLEQARLEYEEVKRELEALDGRDHFYQLVLQRRANYFGKLYRDLKRSIQKNYRDEIADDAVQSQNQEQFIKRISKMASSKAAVGLDPTKMDKHREAYKNTFGYKPSGHTPITTSITDPARHERPKMISTKEVYKVLSHLKNGKACGRDGIFNEMLKVGKTEIAAPMAIMFNICMELGVIPTQWLFSIITPVYKGKGSIGLIINYRPIAVTSAVRRVFERILLPEIELQDEMLEPNQCGFRRRRSTFDQIKLLEEVCHSNPDLYHAFLDIKAAYDTVNRDILWERLRQSTTLSIHYINMLGKLFDENQSILVINGDESRPIKNTRGLLQGSTLSPVLFNHYINDLIKLLNKEEKVKTLGVLTNNAFFADDGNIHTRSREKLQELLDLCSKWAKANGISFAPSKCVTVHRENCQPFRINDGEIPHEEQFKYLGMMMSHKGIDWKESFVARCAKTRKIARFLKWTGMHMNGFRLTTSILLYKTFVRPTLEYGLSVGIATKDVMQMLEATQTAVLRQMFSVNNRTSLKAPLALTNITPISFRNQKLHATYFDLLINKGSITNPIVNMIRNVNLRWLPDGPWSPSFLDIYRNPMIRNWRNPFTGKFTLMGKEAMQLMAWRSIDGLRSRDGDVASAISVDMEGKPNPLLSITFASRRVVGMLLRWRLGIIAIHQKCENCALPNIVTRAHAVACPGILDTLRDKFAKYITGEKVYPTVIDEILENMRYDEDEAELLEILADCIVKIRRVCLGWKENSKGQLRWPTHISHQNQTVDVP